MTWNLEWMNMKEPINISNIDRKILHVGNATCGISPSILFDTINHGHRASSMPEPDDEMTEDLIELDNYGIILYYPLCMTGDYNGVDLSIALTNELTILTRHL